MTDQYLVPIEDIEARAAWRLSRADLELNGELRADWAGRPSVPANVAAELYGQLVEERTRLAIEAARRADVQAARLERARPRRGGIPAPPGVNAPAFAVMRAFDTDREQDDR